MDQIAKENIMVQINEKREKSCIWMTYRGLPERSYMAARTLLPLIRLTQRSNHTPLQPHKLQPTRKKGSNSCWFRQKVSPSTLPKDCSTWLAQP